MILPLKKHDCSFGHFLKSAPKRYEENNHQKTAHQKFYHLLVYTGRGVKFPLPCLPQFISSHVHVHVRFAIAPWFIHSFHCFPFWWSSYIYFIETGTMPYLISKCCFIHAYDATTAILGIILFYFRKHTTLQKIKIFYISQTTVLNSIKAPKGV